MSTTALARFARARPSPLAKVDDASATAPKAASNATPRPAAMPESDQQIAAASRTLSEGASSTTAFSSS